MRGEGLRGNVVRSNMPCRFFKTREGCKFGDQCRFVHEVSISKNPSGGDSNLCRFFFSGESCKYGASCKFSHGGQRNRSKVVLSREKNTASIPVTDTTTPSPDTVMIKPSLGQTVKVCRDCGRGLPMEHFKMVEWYRQHPCCNACFRKNSQKPNNRDGCLVASDGTSDNAMDGYDSDKSSSKVLFSTFETMARIREMMGTADASSVEDKKVDSDETDEEKLNRIRGDIKNYQNLLSGSMKNKSSTSGKEKSKILTMLGEAIEAEHQLLTKLGISTD